MKGIYSILYLSNYTAPDGSPENVTGMATDSITIDLSWDPPPQQLQNGYIVEYRVNVTETDTGDSFSVTTTDTSLVVTSLHPYYTYSCIVAAVTTGVGPYSTVINITTEEAGMFNRYLYYKNAFHFFLIVHLQLQVKPHKTLQPLLSLHTQLSCPGLLLLLKNKMES